MRTLKQLSSLIFICVVALGWTRSAIAQTSALDWRELKSADGGFTIKFPGSPKFETPDLKIGPVAVKRHLNSLQLGQLTFEVDYIDLPAGTDPDGAIEGGVRNIINSFTARGATVLADESVTHGNCTGREVVLATVQPGTTRRGLTQTLIFCSGLRFYDMVFEAPSDTPTNREIGRTFLDSFSVNGGCSSLIAPADAPSNDQNEELVEGTNDAASGWRSFESNELGMRVIMPGTVRHVSRKAQQDPFPLTHHTYIYSKEGSVYSAEVLGDYPEGWHPTPSSYQTAIDVTLYAVKKNFATIGFEINPVRDLRLGTNPGREFSMINQERGLHGRLQIYVTPKRTYIFIAYTRSDSPLTQVSQFFSSIRVSPK
jgi:hypothetical protein